MSVRLGIGSYTFAWAIGVTGFPRPHQPLDAFALLEEAVRLGVSLVQICDNLPLHELPQADLERLARKAAAARIVIEAGTRGSEPELLARYLSIAASVGSPVLRTLVSVDAAGKAMMAEAEATVRAMLPDLERLGITLMLENHDRTTAASMRGLVDRIGSRRVRVCLDPVNNFAIPEDPERVFEALAAVTGEVHIKDFGIRRVDHRLGFLVEGAPAGEGLLDVAPLLARVARERSAQGADDTPLSAVIELWTPWQGSIEATVALERTWADKSVENMKKMLG